MQQQAAQDPLLSSPSASRSTMDYVQQSLWRQPLRLLCQRYWHHLKHELKNVSWTLKGSTITAVICVYVLSWYFVRALPILRWFVAISRLCVLVSLVLVPLFYLNPHALELLNDTIQQYSRSWERTRNSILQSMASAWPVRLLGSFVLIVLPLYAQMQILENITIALLKTTFYYRTALLSTYALICWTLRFLWLPNKKDEVWMQSCNPSSSILRLWFSITTLALISWMDSNLQPGTMLVWLVVLVVSLFVWTQEKPHVQIKQAFRHAAQAALPEVWQYVMDVCQQDTKLQMALMRYIFESFMNTDDKDDSTTAQNSTSSESQWLTLAQRMQGSGTNDNTQRTTTNRATANEIETRLGEGFVNSTDQDGRADSGTILAITQNKMTSSRISAGEPSLRTLLKDMDIDEHVQPLLISYRYFVQRLVPFRTTAIVLAIASRCPGIFLWTLHFVWHTYMSWTTFFHWTILLVPFMLMEAMRVKIWLYHLQLANPNENTSDNTKKRVLFDNLHPLVILWSEDYYDLQKMPHFFVRLYQTILQSVKKFEQAVTTTRCVQTTVAAADLATNVMVLAELAVEIQQQGWVAGVVILMREYVLMQQQEQQRDQQDQSTRYSQAATDVVRNSQKIRHNLQMLLQDENVGPVLHPVLHAISVIFGNGWLWGRQTDDRPTPKSTVTVEILDDNYDTSHENDEDVVDVTPLSQVERLANQPLESHDEDFVPCSTLDENTDIQTGNNTQEKTANSEFQVTDNESQLLNRQPTQQAENINLKILTAQRENKFLSCKEETRDDVVQDVSVDSVCETDDDLNNSKIESVNTHSPTGPLDVDLKLCGKVIEAESLEKMSKAMELISECNEHGLIEMDEKNLLCEKLAIMEFSNEPDKNWVNGIIYSLERLLQVNSYENVESNDKHEVHEPQEVIQNVPVSQTTVKSDGSIIVEAMSAECTGAENTNVLLNKNKVERLTLEHTSDVDNTNTEKKSLSTSHTPFENDVVAEVKRNKVCSNSSYESVNVSSLSGSHHLDADEHFETLDATVGSSDTTTLHTYGTHITDVRESHADTLEDEDDSYEPLDIDYNTGESSQEAGCSMKQASGEASSEVKEEPQNMWMNFAVAGVAAVGLGLTLLNNHDQRNRRRQNGNSS